jgi:AcrR family transcriptional regulator
MAVTSSVAKQSSQPKRTRGGEVLKSRILDFALDQFVTKGYRETSMREIAENLGVSKAALYYHFENKEDILLALHMQMHQLARQLLPLLDNQSKTGTGWGPLVDGMIDVVLVNRRLLEMHLRNKDAIAELHTAEVIAKHGGVDFDLEVRFARLLGDSAVSVNERVRRMASLGAIAGVMLGSGMVGEVSNDELAALIRSVVGDILRPT